MRTANLTVVLANFNHARYLPRALDALLTQTVRPREILAIDDASQDNSLDVLTEYARREPCVRVVRNEKNLGVVPTCNKGIALANSEYMLFAAADDYTLPTLIEKSVAMLDRHRRAALCFAYDSYTRGDGGPLVVNPSGWCESPQFFSPEQVCRHLRHNIPGHAVVCRREPLLKAGCFLPDLRWYCDWFAFLTMAFRHGACHVPETLAVRVVMEASYSAGAHDRAKNVATLQAFFDRIVSPEYSDVAPYFRRNGAATFHGTDLLRAAATRPDRWNSHILRFLNGFAPEQYEELQSDADPAVREMAGFFLGPFWMQFAEKRAQKENEIILLRDELELTRKQVPPPGALGKLRWLAKSLARKLGRARSYSRM